MVGTLCTRQGFVPILTRICYTQFNHNPKSMLVNTRIVVQFQKYLIMARYFGCTFDEDYLFDMYVPTNLLMDKNINSFFLFFFVLNKIVFFYFKGFAHPNRYIFYLFSGFYRKFTKLLKPIITRINHSAHSSAGTYMHYANTKITFICHTIYNIHNTFIL